MMLYSQVCLHLIDRHLSNVHDRQVFGQRRGGRRDEVQRAVVAVVTLEADARARGRI